ncbi:MAG: redox-sensing transcriptional repressor Rex [Spirochaetes bacterium]|nr:redox-sensing transcriptional repressor Rex [Spirochaetota bacterium]
MGRKIRTGHEKPGRKEKEKISQTVKKIGKAQISSLSIERLLLYSNYFDILTNNKIENVQSTEIADFFGLESAQIRKDLSYVGKFGKRGYGYNVKSLKKGIDAFLYKNRSIKSAIVGIGNLGSALLGYKIFSKMGIHVVAGFDINSSIINKKINDIPIYHIDDLITVVQKEQIKIGVITTPSSEAKKIYQLMLKTNIKGIVNFAPYHLTSRSDVFIKNIDLSLFFEILRYELYRPKK